MRVLSRMPTDDPIDIGGRFFHTRESSLTLMTLEIGIATAVPALLYSYVRIYKQVRTSVRVLSWGSLTWKCFDFASTCPPNLAVEALKMGWLRADHRPGHSTPADCNSQERGPRASSQAVDLLLRCLHHHPGSLPSDKFQRRRQGAVGRTRIAVALLVVLLSGQHRGSYALYPW